MPLARSQALLVLSAAILLAGALALRLISGDPSDAVSVLYTVPVALIAFTFGLRGGLLAAATAALLAATVVEIGGRLSALGLLDRTVAFVVVGAGLGLLADRTRGGAAEVRRRERLFRRLLEGAPDAVVIVDGSGRIALASDRAGEVFGAAPSRLVGHPVDILVPPEARAAFVRDRRAYLARPTRLAMGEGREIELLRRDGSRFPAEISLSPLETDGEVLISAAVRDVTARRCAEDRLRRWADVFATAGWGVVVTDPETDTIEAANPAFAAMHGTTPDALRGRPILDLFAPEARGEAISAMRLAEAAGRCSFESLHVRADGTVFPVTINATVSLDEAGRPLYRVVHVEDITERRREAAERDLQAAVAANLSDGVAVITADDERIVYANRSLARMFGYDPQEMPGLPIATLYTEPDSLTQIAAETRRHGHCEGLVEMRRKDGARLWSQLRRSAFEHPAYGPVWISVHTDVTALHTAQTARRRAEERFRRAFENAPNGMALVSTAGDGAGRLLDVNRAFGAITGRDPEQATGSMFDAVLAPPGGGRHDLLARILDPASQPVEVPVARDGSDEPVWVSVTASRSSAPEDHAIVQIQNVTERHVFEGRLQYLADHDALTGLWNRRRFEEELEHQLAVGVRHGMAAALLLIDLDHFKYVNDTLGHAAGDQLIARAAAVLRERTRDSDVVARLGGDEFAVLLTGEDAERAADAARGMLAALRTESVTVDGHDVRISASIGIARLPEAEGADAESSLVAADIAMYEAKDLGRGRVAVARAGHESQQRMTARLGLVHRIQAAIDEDGFVLHAQPIVDVRTGLPRRHELLVRMRLEGSELLSPDRFIPVAEEHGQIQAIDRWVVGRAIELIAASERRGLPAALSVNLSGGSISDEGVGDFVEERIHRAGIDPSRLQFEVTETAAVTNLDRAQGFADRMAGLGCRFALDDFGAGFASFYYLKRLPFDCVKIDGDFIRQLTHNRVDRLTVEAIVRIARGLGKETVAECVGDEETLELLRALDVDFAQGYFIGRPGPTRAAQPAGAWAAAASRTRSYMR